MDLLISLLLGIVLLAVLIVWIMSAIGIGEQFLNPLVAVLGAPLIWLARDVNGIRRKRGIKRLPSDVPPPPAGP